MGKVLGKAFNPTRRIRTDERKCMWVVDQDSHLKFRVNLKCFFGLFLAFLV